MEEGCNPGAPVLIPKDDWMEMDVIMGFRVWQLMFLALAGLITVVVLLCCFMKCRVPRTKQEIEADFKRKEITRRFRFLLDRVQIEDTSLRTAIEKVNELYTNREKMKKRKKKKPDDEEEIISLSSSYLFEDEKLTIIQRVKKLIGLLKDDDSGSDDDSMKEKSDKSEDTKKSSDDDLTSLPEVHKVTINKIIQQSEDSRESSDSPKIDSHSKISLLQDSPPRTHDTLSKLSLLQDSPPNCGLSLLHDTPVHKRKLSKESTMSDSQDSKKGYSKQKTESQESRESETSTKRQDSINSQDKSAQKRTDFKELSKHKFKKLTTDSQESDDVQSSKQKSDSQDSNEFEQKHIENKNKKIFEPRDSNITRRESLAAQSPRDSSRKWGEKSPIAKSKESKKASKSLDVVAPTSH